MSKGLAAIKAAQTGEAGGGTKSRRSYLKKDQTIYVRIPEKIIDEIHVKQVVAVWQKILPTLAYKANNIEGKRDLFDEALKLMKEDHFKAVNSGKIEKGSEADKESYRNALQLQPKPTYLFGVIPLEDFTQGKYTFEAGEPLILETNNGKNGANINSLVTTLQKLEKKFNTKAFEITATGSNTYTILPVDVEDLTPEQKEVFDKTAGVVIPEEVYDTALFEADEQNQAHKLDEIGFDVSRLGITLEKPAEDGGLGDITDDDLPF